MPATRIDSGAAVSALLQHYSLRPGVADELLLPDGRIRTAWSGFIDYLAAMPADQLKHRTARGDHYLRDAGVYYRQYNEGISAEKDWPLSHIPILIDETDWATISAGLIQRANLLETVVRDIYGGNRLAAEGRLPASVIAASPEWLRPLVGVTPRGGNFLNFIAFEIGRGPDGDWWVLGDRTQAPSGVGFALQNRVAMARAFGDYYAQANIHRLAGFFRQFRDGLDAMREPGSNRVAILTPGPLNETYFEHAYIARYLGFALLEGEDLTVEKGELKVRTVGGPVPVDVLWRRLDSNFADPLELNARSHLGTPGLVGAVRQGSVALVNALGSGILETRALLAFLPGLSRHLLGERLILPNIATWWCGEREEADHVRRHADTMLISDALSTSLPFEADRHGLPGRTPQALLRRLNDNGGAYVGQEVVTLSTTPALIDGQLTPRPMSLRVFLARTANGWSVMPGGFARIGRSNDAAAVAMREGGAAADVWIVSSKPVPKETMLDPAGASFSRPLPETLPSRAADNLFWLGRYVERAEGDLRLLRSLHLRLSETPDGSNPTIALLREALEQRGLDPDASLPEGFLDTIQSARTSAGKIRDRFSVDGWMALTDIAKTANRLAPRLGDGDDAARAAGMLLRKISGFTGLVHENMYRFIGWRFMSIGRALERAQFMLSVLADLTQDDAPEGALDLAVELGDSAMTHRRRYAVATRRETVIDLLALDPLNPRAVLFSANEIHEHVGFLTGAASLGQTGPLARATLQMQSGLAVLTPESFDDRVINTVRAQAFGLSDILATTYFR